MFACASGLAAKVAGPVVLAVTCDGGPVVYATMRVGSTEDPGFQKSTTATYVFQNGNSEKNVISGVCANALSQLKAKEGMP